MEKRTYTILFAMIMLLVFVSASFAQVSDAPSSVVAALTIKLAGFAQNVSGTAGDVTVYVLGAPDVAAELQKGVGKPIGKATLSKVESGTDLPATPPSILCVGDASKLDAAISFTQANKVLSVTGLTDLVAKGVTLGIGVGADNKPKILLNLTSSNEEGISWNPAIMKVAKTIK